MTDRLSTTQRVLAFCARPSGDAGYYRQLAELAGGVDDWSQVPEQAEHHGLGPLV